MDMCGFNGVWVCAVLGKYRGKEAKGRPRNLWGGEADVCTACGERGHVSGMVD